LIDLAIENLQGLAISVALSICSFTTSLTFKFLDNGKERGEEYLPFIGPWEIALILIVVVLLFGAKRIPQLAKSMGEAIRQYRKATEEDEPPESEENVETLMRTAKKLGIDTEGKTPQEISDEILDRAKA